MQNRGLVFLDHSDIYGSYWIGTELVMGWVHPWVGLGWVGSKTMGHLTLSVSIDDVYKLNISYQCIKKWHRRDLRWDPSICLTYTVVHILVYVTWRVHFCSSHFILNNNGTIHVERVPFRFYCWVGLSCVWTFTLVDRIGLGLREKAKLSLG